MAGNKPELLCFNCGLPATVNHHVVPKARGGHRTVPLCGRCHGLAHHTKRNMTTGHLTRVALAAKRSAGELTGGVPFGWVADGTGRLVAVEAEQAILRIIGELRQAGVSLRKIASILTTAGHRTKKGKATWYAETVKSILQRQAALQEGGAA